MSLTQRSLLRVRLLACAAFVLLPLGMSLANAATFTVTKTADTNDGVCNADCSLREAITAANGNGVADLIAFNIPLADPGFNAGTGVFTIAPVSGSVNDPLMIALDSFKRALQVDGTPIADLATVPTGLLVKFLIYVTNYGSVLSDIGLQDVLDPTSDTGSTTLDLGDENNVNNAQLDLAADSAWALVYTVSMQ